MNGLYDVDSSWPTECGQSRRRSRKVECKRINHTTNKRSFSTTDSQRNVLCRQQRTESQYVIGTNTGTRIQRLRERQRFRLTSVSIGIHLLLPLAARFMALYIEQEVGVPGGWLARTANEQPAYRGGARYRWRRSKSPSASDKAVMISASLISRWSFGILVLMAASPAIVSRATVIRKSLHGVSRTPTQCRQTPGERSGRRCAGIVLLYPRPLGTSPWAGHADEVTRRGVRSKKDINMSEEGTNHRKTTLTNTDTKNTEPPELFSLAISLLLLTV
ncbi:hypothetical protein T12_3150 [Trichinella patagoniensis]|uniref:Uncharacterized protein n=1 Tax=Trichinella patagoniensis TaxID=990121 RepID=A0A0V0ZAK4_9BILA|nr:hypothetical protein T12_3150 [Trichinella patagoniensis]